MALAPKHGLVHVEPVQGVGVDLPHVLRDGDGPSEANFATQFSQQLLLIRAPGLLFGTEFHYLTRISP